ncbi:MAG: outer membrane beta-barrel protein [Candidatus Acidiferrales bacterium]
MRIKTAILVLALSLFCIPALAQLNGQSEVSADFTGNFQKQATGLGLTDTPSDSGGLLLNYRYHFNNWSAIEVNYGRTRFTQYYSSGDQTQSNANELTLAYVNTFGVSPDARFRPFVEAGTGGLIFAPVMAGSFSDPLTQDRMVFLYGGGVDFNATHNFSVRLGYRGLIYKAPDFALGDQTANALTQMAEPYVGVVFHF